MSEIAEAGKHVDGPVVKGGEVILVKMPDWPAFSFDRVSEVLDVTWEHAAVLAEKRTDWLVMWVRFDDEE